MAVDGETFDITPNNNEDLALAMRCLHREVTCVSHSGDADLKVMFTDGGYLILPSRMGGDDWHITLEDGSSPVEL